MPFLLLAKDKVSGKFQESMLVRKSRGHIQLFQQQRPAIFRGNKSDGRLHQALRAMEAVLKERFTPQIGSSWLLRCLPYFYVAGFSKCGTTDLAATLNHHKEIVAPATKEMRYWNRIRYSSMTKPFQ